MEIKYGHFRELDNRLRAWFQVRHGFRQQIHLRKGQRLSERAGDERLRQFRQPPVVGQFDIVCIHIAEFGKVETRG